MVNNEAHEVCTKFNRVRMCTVIMLAASIVTSTYASIFKGAYNLIFHNNFHTIEQGVAYRSGTMPAKTLARRIRRLGIKTVINLRGIEPGKKWWQRESEKLNQMGITFYNIPMNANVLPSKQTALALFDTFKKAERPVLIHCQAGADRTSLASAFWQITQQNYPKKRAYEQLSNSFGHLTNRYPAMRFFIKILPDDPEYVRSWLKNWYDPANMPEYNTVSSPRFYDMNFGIVEKGKLYRSAQLKPVELRRTIDTYGIKTIINLYGPAPGKDWYTYEHITANRAGAKVHDLTWYVDALPPRNTLLTLLDLYDNATQPILIHCRDGADRTGETAAIWKLYKQNATIAHAKKQLTLRHKHFAFMHPAKAFFINQWKGGDWARTTYRPELYKKYQPPHPSASIPVAA